MKKIVQREDGLIFRNTARPSIPVSVGRVSAAISKGIDRQDRDIAVRQEIFL